MLFNMVRYIIFGLLVSLLSFTSCLSDSLSTLAPLPLAVGKTNEIRIVCDLDDWEGQLGDSIRYHFQAPFLILPKPEPMFDLKHFTAEQVINNELRRNLRTYVLVGDLSDTDSPTTKLIMQDLNGEKLRRAKEDPSFNTMIGKNKWETGQVLVYLFGNNEQELYKNIREKYPTIARRLNDFDNELVSRAAYVYGESNLLNNKMRDLMNVEVHIPADYELAMERSIPAVIKEGDQVTEDAVPGIDIVWMRRVTEEERSDIFAYSLPYTSKDQFKKQNVIDLINKIGKNHISSTIEGSYLVINDVDLPVYSTDMTINGSYAVEIRGVWEMENDFMGGPFISYLVHNEKDGRLILLNGFVYAPSLAKRNYMQELAVILKNSKV